ncbi:hypothetical protein D5086_003511 [Populus alba]|uniref:Uncharacterized protein n=3 Tax=Populus TaxID=3689 RepID=A0ACC4D4P1_POPAL|nr:hypothetical protein NC653_004160 [Populus alba x Populus x berolinensis]TKS05592.1 hypothetical protein D5086_0000131310 [Populus alba]
MRLKSHLKLGLGCLRFGYDRCQVCVGFDAEVCTKVGSRMLKGSKIGASPGCLLAQARNNLMGLDLDEFKALVAWATSKVDARKFRVRAMIKSRTLVVRAKTGTRVQIERLRCGLGVGSIQGLK